MEAFITGSTAYGAPNENSDIDIIVFSKYEIKAGLAGLTAKSGGYYCSEFRLPTRHETEGKKLDFIFVYGENDYMAWYVATKVLQAVKKISKPVDTETATEFLKKIKKTKYDGLKFYFESDKKITTWAKDGWWGHLARERFGDFFRGRGFKV